jgi:hypothetical protein
MKTATTTWFVLVAGMAFGAVFANGEVASKEDETFWDRYLEDVDVSLR